jgi:hypothetical protein
MCGKASAGFTSRKDPMSPARNLLPPYLKYRTLWINAHGASEPSVNFYRNTRYKILRIRSSKFDSFVKLGAGRSGVSLLSQTRNCSFLLNVQIGWGAVQWVQGVFFSGLKRSELEVGNSPSSSALVKSEWSSASARPVCVHVVHKDYLICKQ